MSTKICSILILIYWLLSLSPCHTVGERPGGLLGNHPALSHRGRGTPAELVITVMMVMMVMMVSMKMIMTMVMRLNRS